MKILMLTPYLPWPLHSGGQIRTYNLLKNLAQKHEITLFSFIRDDAESEYLPKLEPFCKKILVFKRTKSPWALRNILLSGFTPYPFLVCIYLSGEAQRALKHELDDGYDIIHAETFYVMPNIPKTPVPTLLVEQTIEYLGYQTYTVQKAPLLIRPLLMIDVVKLRFWEDWYWKRADLLVTMSEEDRRWITTRVPRARVEVVANGIDVSYFRETKPVRPKNPTVLFVGNYKWLPNVDAAEYLIEKIWPLIHEKIPSAQLRIVGRDVTDRIKKMGESTLGVRVIGEVEDIRDALARAHVMLVPIRNGRGTRYKILESMAARLPVVSTTLGIEGIRAKDGVHAFIRDTDRGLAEATIKLLDERETASRLSQAAFELVTAHYNWETISADLDRIYRKLGKRV